MPTNPRPTTNNSGSALEVDKEQQRAAEAQLKLAETQKQAAQAQKDTADLEKQTAEAYKAARDNLFPQSEFKAPTAETTVDTSSGQLADFVAIKAMQSAAEQAAAEIDKAVVSNARILIVDSLDFASGDFPLLQIDSAFTQFEAVFDAQEKILTDLIPVKPPEPESLDMNGERWRGAFSSPRAFRFADIATVPFAANSVVSLLASAASYFQVSYQIKGRDSALKAEPLKAFVAGKLTKPTFLFNFHTVEKSAVLERFTTIVDRRNRIEQLRSQLSATAGAEEPRKTLVETAAADWDRIKASFDAMTTMITAKGANGETPPLVLAAVREQIRSQYQDTQYLLYLNVNLSGGEVITARRLFRSPRMSYTAGCSITYVLANKNGKIAASNTITEVCDLEYVLHKREESKLRRINFDVLS